ncbi:hypothetical protein VTN02DRAFT_4683 [Thermoascus thermophilus]
MLRDSFYCLRHRYLTALTTYDERSSDLLPASKWVSTSQGQPHPVKTNTISSTRDESARLSARCDPRVPRSRKSERNNARSEFPLPPTILPPRRPPLPHDLHKLRSRRRVELVLLHRRIPGLAVGRLHRRADQGHRLAVSLYLGLDPDRHALDK